MCPKIRIQVCNMQKGNNLGYKVRFNLLTNRCMGGCVRTNTMLIFLKLLILRHKWDRYETLGLNESKIDFFWFKKKFGYIQLQSLP